MIITGDCLEVMAGMEAESIDTIITDPPYGLSDGREDVGKIFVATFFDVVLPCYQKLVPQALDDFNLSLPCDRRSLLGRVDRSVWVEPGIAMPKRSIDLHDRVVFWKEKIEYASILTKVVSDGMLVEEGDADTLDEGPHFFLNLRPCRDASFRDGDCGGMAELGNGLLTVPVVISFDSLFAGFLRTLAPSGPSFLCDLVRILNNPAGNTHTSAYVMTGAGAELRAVLSLDVANGTLELKPASRTSNPDFVAELRCAKGVGAGSSTSSLPPMFQAYRVGVVGDSAYRTCSICLHSSIIQQARRARKGFMGKDWDHGIPGVAFWEAALRVAKPGAFLLAFGGTRTYHRLTCAIEDAGWEIRDCMLWVYGSGFPKSHDISKAIDKAAGAEREVVGINADYLRRKPNGMKTDGATAYGYSQKQQDTDPSITAPATEAAKLWDGWGTALKPAYEPIIVAMKPLDGTFANNALTHGVAGLNIDGGRIGTSGARNNGRKKDSEIYGDFGPTERVDYDKGRWPANVILDEAAGEMLDEQSGENPSRFFYCAKASRSERGECNHHPTVKPLDLMAYLCKLTMTPTGGTVLDPFCGSGSTIVAAIQVGREAIGIEKNPEYSEIARARVSHARGPLFGAAESEGE